MNKRAEKYLLNLVARNYENIASAFDQSRKKPMKPMVYQITESLNLPQNFRVLDLGCGNACFLPVLSLYYKDFFYLGLDASAELISLARKNYNNNFKVLNILDIDKLEEEKFDLIVSWAVLHHLPGRRLRQELLQKVYHLLAEEGFFIFSVWKLSNFKKKKSYSFFKTWIREFLRGRIIDRGDYIFLWGGEAKNDLDRLRYYHNFSKKELDKMIKKTPFKIKEFLEDEFNYYYILKK